MIKYETIILQVTIGDRIKVLIPESYDWSWIAHRTESMSFRIPPGAVVYVNGKIYVCKHKEFDDKLNKYIKD